MSLIDSIILQFLRVLSRAPDEVPSADGLSRFGDGRVQLRTYYEYWQKQIRLASKQHRVMSNGWAFSTLSGIAAFESYVHGDPAVRALYFDKVGDIEMLADRIAETKGQRPFGAMVYGYGNLIREAQWLEHLLRKRILTRWHRVCLIDCSLFYHVFANSHLNPLRELFKLKKLQCLLIDCFNGQLGRDRLNFIRDDLNAARPTIHIFLGNTFGNVPTETVRGLLDSTVRPGDFVIAEYAKYSAKFLKDVSPDYTSAMAKRAAAEIFFIPESEVDVKNVAESGCRYTEIEVPDSSSGGKLKFKSMLRRAFKRSEVTDLEYTKIGSKKLAGEKVQVDVFRRTPS